MSALIFALALHLHTSKNALCSDASTRVLLVLPDSSLATGTILSGPNDDSE